MDNQFTSKRFGQKLRDLRKMHGIAMKDLAERLRYMPHGYISEIENGKKQPSITLVLKISKLFNVSTDQLLKDDLEISIDEDD
jgi:transcriptional regulator with XRE-family HTH domain